MPEQTTDSPFRRRAEDMTQAGGVPTAQDAWIRSGLAHKRLDEFEAKGGLIDRAFVKDDLGTPDFEGHRRAHANLIEADKLLQSYKNEATKKVIGWIVAVLLGALGSSAAAWLQRHI